MARPVVKKQDIEDAAIRLFATKGLAQTTVKDIASEAGVTEGALYRHYPGKNAMAWQLFCRELEKFSGELGRRMFEPGAPLAERLEASIRFIFEYYAQYPVQFAFILLTQHGFPEERILDVVTNPNDMVERFVAEAVNAGDIPAMDRTLGSGLLLGLVLQVMVMHRYDRIKIDATVVGEVVGAAKRVLMID
ncbi:HTH-type transcriptional regulator AcrR [Pseudodesulfovibrio hydrargyri]|uniref:HTH-type transcriptional regulator AcrR n=1 Tax=Pseudodesulfovibrio hydrargyri TaxID=2125990 RepID=A0A1J5MYE8_9BACT|nr:TetR family transcriptional regulator [Pseudodesulfovibrio hydrargyri]OIQ50860.1 HTH-type transcriptional regulator AcrR [Pseudodesulfovibrio hydrargyri]